MDSRSMKWNIKMCKFRVIKYHLSDVSYTFNIFQLHKFRKLKPALTLSNGNCSKKNEFLSNKQFSLRWESIECKKIRKICHSILNKWKNIKEIIGNVTNGFHSDSDMEFNANLYIYLNRSKDIVIQFCEN